MSSTRVIANRSQLQLWKGKLIGATKGHSLLKRKLEGLKKAFALVMEKLIKSKKKIKRSSSQIQLFLKHKGGVYLPQFKPKIEQIEDPARQLGIAGGGASIQKTKDRFTKLLNILTKIAGYQASYHTLDDIIRITSRRVNALENVVIPRFQGYIAYIIKELDEMEREDFFMLKKVQENKKKQMEKARIQRELEAESAIEEEAFTSIVSQVKDEDIIF